MLIPRSALPVDPFFYDVPGSLGQTIKFFNYGLAIPQANTLRCLLDASKDILQQLTLTGGGELPVNEELRYQYGNVFFVLHPQEMILTWNMWAHTIGGIYWFVTNYGFRDFEFEILEMGFSQAVGTGILVSP